MWYVIGPLLLGESVILAALSLSVMSVVIATFSVILPELRSLPPQVDPTAEGKNWPEER